MQINHGFIEASCSKEWALASTSIALGRYISFFNIFIYLFWVFIEVEMMEPSCHDVTLTLFCVCSGMLSASFKAPNNRTHIGGALEISILLTMAQMYNQNNCLVLPKQLTRLP